ncbi:hypothetical protein BYT27DRAFT_7259044 [Phlegmacium glaucopus]|nr:hypothetical protein BYT27DRAFT_7259044 [Phlegmacium glaucopus]
MLDEEVARVARERRAETAGAELMEKLSLARKSMNDSRRLTVCYDTRRKKWIKNIVNGYPECKKDVATVEKLEASYEETLIYDFEIE